MHWNAADRRLERTGRHALRAGGSGRDGVGNAAEKRRARRKNLETDHLRLEALQLIEIPQNHQSFGDIILAVPSG